MVDVIGVRVGYPEVGVDPLPDVGGHGPAFLGVLREHVLAPDGRVRQGLEVKVTERGDLQVLGVAPAQLDGFGRGLEVDHLAVGQAVGALALVGGEEGLGEGQVLPGVADEFGVVGGGDDPGVVPGDAGRGAVGEGEVGGQDTALQDAVGLAEKSWNYLLY